MAFIISIINGIHLSSSLEKLSEDEVMCLFQTLPAYKLLLFISESQFNDQPWTAHAILYYTTMFHINKTTLLLDYGL